MLFKPEDIRGLNQTQDALERIQGLENWTGGDVTLEGKATIEPGQSRMDQKIIISKKNLPPIKFDRGVLGYLNWSVRSFLAQSGIDITFHKSDLTDEMTKAIERGEEVALPVSISNYGQRAVEIEGKVMRFFWVNEKNRIKGMELREIIGKELVIGGEEGKDWFLADTEWDARPPKGAVPDFGNPNDAVCIVLRLSDDRMYIPYAPEPVAQRDNKDRLKGVLQPIPKDLELNFEIRETPQIKLSENLTAVIPTHAYVAGAHHIHSPLIDGGSDWPIRTETYGLNAVEFYIYRNK